jgi:hypothetical protein
MQISSDYAFAASSCPDFAPKATDAGDAVLDMIKVRGTKPPGGHLLTAFLHMLDVLPHLIRLPPEGLLCRCLVHACEGGFSVIYHRTLSLPFGFQSSCVVPPHGSRSWSTWTLRGA